MMETVARQLPLRGDGRLGKVGRSGDVGIVVPLIATLEKLKVQENVSTEGDKLREILDQEVSKLQSVKSK